MCEAVTISAAGEDEGVEVSVLVEGIWVHQGIDVSCSGLLSLKHCLSLLAMALLEDNYLH